MLDSEQAALPGPVLESWYQHSSLELEVFPGATYFSRTGDASGL